MSLRPVLVLGGASEIGLAVARRFAREGHAVQLAARRPEELERERSDIALRHGVEVSLHLFDALDDTSVDRLLDELPGMPGTVVCAVGLLGDQALAERDPTHARLIVETNLTGPMIALEALARRLAAADEPGAIIGIGSVAGDRGRAKNYWYGAAKAGFAEALSGMRQRFRDSDLSVLTIKPGFVATRMTAGMSTPAHLTASAEQIADIAYRAWYRKRPVSYPLRWGIVMTIIRLIPERLFARLSF